MCQEDNDERRDEKNSHEGYSERTFFTMRRLHVGDGYNRSRKRWIESRPTLGRDRARKREHRRDRRVHFDSSHGRKKSITYCDVGNEILRLIKHSSLACHEREGHRGAEETRQEHEWVDISLTSKVPAKVFQPSRASGFPVTNVSVEKGITGAGCADDETAEGNDISLVHVWL